MGENSVLERQQAFREGVIENADVPVIIIDPNQLDPNDPIAAGENMRQQLEQQIPGSASALQSRFQESQNKEFGIDSAHVPFSEIADMLVKSGPASIDRVMVDGQEYCVINAIGKNIDEVHEIGPILSLSTDPRLLDNLDGNDIQYNRFIGRHEGEHCNRPENEDTKPDSYDETAQTQKEESRADNGALKDDMAFRLEIKDLRSLASGGIRVEEELIKDTDHATGATIDHADGTTRYHAEAAETFRERMDGYADLAISDGIYTGDALNAQELLLENPNAYFAIADAGFAADLLIADAQYNQNPTLEGGEKIVTGQLQSDYAHHFEDAYRRRVLGENIPSTDPKKYFSEESIDAFYDYADEQLEPYVREEICASEATVISPNGLNMRQEADQFSAPVVPNDDGKPSALPYGSQIDIYGSETSDLGGVWREAVTNDGRSGWVSENYLDVQPEICRPAERTGSSPLMQNDM